VGPDRAQLGLGAGPHPSLLLTVKAADGRRRYPADGRLLSSGMRRFQSPLCSNSKAPTVVAPTTVLNKRIGIFDSGNAAGQVTILVPSLPASLPSFPLSHDALFRSSAGPGCLLFGNAAVLNRVVGFRPSIRKKRWLCYTHGQHMKV
jgi:hypothetical protein